MKNRQHASQVDLVQFSPQIIERDFEPIVEDEIEETHQYLQNNLVNGKG